MYVNQRSKCWKLLLCWSIPNKVYQPLGNDKTRKKEMRTQKKIWKLFPECKLWCIMSLYIKLWDFVTHQFIIERFVKRNVLDCVLDCALLDWVTVDTIFMLLQLSVMSGLLSAVSYCIWSWAYSTITSQNKQLVLEWTWLVRDWERISRDKATWAENYWE